MYHRSKSELAVLSILCAVFLGCTRRDYRVSADHEVSGLISQKVCPQWHVPDRLVTPDPRSRMADLTDPDCPPMPPDDPAAHCWMLRPGCWPGHKHWHKFGDLPFIEFEDWQNYLPVDQQYRVILDRKNAIQLALLHSRQYQTEIEQLYQQALILSLERFEFDVQWSGGASAFFDAVGRGDFGSRQLTVNDNIGFSRNLIGGGQILADFANSFVWEFAGGQVSAASSSILLRMTQPLLRGAFRHVRLESLTQTERNLLYEVRNFAQFRRAFYVNVLGQGGYLGLLQTAQSIKNQETNLESLRRNLEEHEALAQVGQVGPIQVDQVFQDYEQGRLGLLAARQSLETALDDFKLQVGLPPELEFTLDESILNPFELSNKAFEQLAQINETLRLAILQFDADNPPNAEQLKKWFESLKNDFEKLKPLNEEVLEELGKWEELIASDAADSESDVERTESERRKQMAFRMRGQLEEIRLGLETDIKQLVRLERLLNEISAELTEEERLARLSALWTQVKDFAGKTFRERLADLTVIQTQVRVYLIRVQPVRLHNEAALAIAAENRLDLMNARGRVIDAYRRVEVAADALEGDLNLSVEADLATDPTRNNAFRFDSSAHRYRAGIEFDSPLNRLAERNTYRAAQLSYQQARRDFMLTKDEVARQIRFDLRRLEFDRFQFEITRRQLIAAARQVELAQINLRSTQAADSSLTRDLLNALQQLLSAKNNLIGSWVSYENSRMNLFRDLAVMQIDGEGVWINEFDAYNDTSIVTDTDSAGAGSGPADDDAQNQPNRFDANQFNAPEAPNPNELVEPAT